MNQVKQKSKTITYLTRLKAKTLLFFTLLLFCFAILEPQNSHATDGYGVGRTRSCSASGAVEDMQFDPVYGHDMNFVADNPVCLTVISLSYAAVKISIINMNSVCGNNASIRVLPSPILDTIDIGRSTVKAATTNNAACASATLEATASLAKFVEGIAVIYGIAESAFEKTKLCGADWKKADPTTYTISTPNYQQTVYNAVQNYINNDETSLMTLNNKTFREWYYGGVEIEDNPSGSDACRDPTQAKVGGQYPKQKYYFKGTEAGNFNCKKYMIFAGQDDPLTGQAITPERVEELKSAYECCKKRSSEYVCIDFSHKASSSSSQVFCRSGSRCILKNEGLNVTFSAKPVNNGEFICAESYSLCPYNFSVGGGGETCDYYQDGVWNSSQGRWDLITQEDIEDGNCRDKSEIRNSDCTYNAKAGQCRNYCQYMTHCTKANDVVYTYESSLNSPYFSTACLDFIGDSRNEISYNLGFIPGSQRHFSAPIAQCIKETMENVFYNRFGHSQCRSSSELPASNGACASNNYISFNGVPYFKGSQVSDQSFFAKVQNNIQLTIKLILSMSVMFYGVKILIGMSGFGKKDLLLYLTKIALVLYFSTGDAWHSQFFDGVYNASSELSEIVFKISVSSDENKRDGCQFGTMTFSDGTEENVTSAARSYPPGKDYLALWDTLDCKIARYLGFGPEASAANIALLILSGFFTGPWGLYFAMSLMFFGFFLIATTIRALHIFLSSCMAIILLVYISPLVIPAVLFNKTSGIFKGWVNQLLGFCLQPLILFAYIAILIMMLDKTLIGNATFHGSGPNKTISCKEFCTNSAGSVITADVDPECDDLGNSLVNPMEDSVACMINLNNFGKFPGLEIIGITIPILVDFFQGDVKAKILTLVKGALVMYLLFKFMDEIPGMASYFMGGSGLGSGGDIFDKGMKYFKGAMGFARDLQKRGTGATKNAARTGYDKAQDISRKLGDKDNNDSS
ncbi:MAG: hypothetical protein FJ368_01705 [Pelagibacterales bacterium]|nr:hypothetical protein [Pelagibacterales bacterium]